LNIPSWSRAEIQRTLYGSICAITSVRKPIRLLQTGLW
jgi:hypothetical protein